MNPQGKCKELFDELSRINKTAYADKFHLANHVLSKTPCCGMRERYERNVPPPRFSGLQIALRVVRTWAVHIAVIGLMLLARIAQKRSGMNNARRLNKNIHKFTLVDIFILVNKVLDEKKFKDPYLPGLIETLQNRGCNVFILARFYGTRNPRRLKQAFSILKKHDIPIITEYELFTLADWLELLKFGIQFPFRALELARNLEQEEKSEAGKYGAAASKTSPLAHISSALIQCLGQNYLAGEARRLAARRLAKLLPPDSRIIGWYENQTVDKCFYRGLAEAGAAFPTIGAQLFSWPAELLNNHADPADGMHRAIPKKVLVNGPFFLPSASGQDGEQSGFSVEVPGSRPCVPYPGGPEYQLGPSLRYKELFEVCLEPDPDAPVLMLLSYHRNEAERVLALARPLAEKGVKLAIRFHPAVNRKEFEHLLPPSYISASGTLLGAMQGASMVVGAGSGTLAEAVCMGLPVIAVVPKDGTGLNYLPDYGQGELWDVITDLEAFFPVREKLLELLKGDRALRQERINAFRSLLFTRPDEEKIIQAFEL
ncbi:MAG: hypothetical protein IJD04_04375 [Desulfovibrionaceae bacterium]|nr:hypothetical protein [Desulfovibrionaceae bacterium]